MDYDRQAALLMPSDEKHKLFVLEMGLAGAMMINPDENIDKVLEAFDEICYNATCAVTHRLFAAIVNTHGSDMEIEPHGFAAAVKAILHIDIFEWEFPVEYIVMALKAVPLCDIDAMLKCLKEIWLTQDVSKGLTQQ